MNRTRERVETRTRHDPSIPEVDVTFEPKCSMQPLPPMKPTPTSALGPPAINHAAGASQGNSAGDRAMPCEATAGDSNSKKKAIVAGVSAVAMIVAIGALFLLAGERGLPTNALLARAPDPSNASPSSVAPGAALAQPAVRGVTDTEIKIGMSAAFSGPSRELGQNMKLGIETAFQAVNDTGGVHGRKLTLIALDDGYEASRAAQTTKDLLEHRGVFAFAGNVGTPTSAMAAPYAARNKTVFFGAFTGSPSLRQVPPDRYVFNYRASSVEEIARSVSYLVEIKKIPAQQMAVFAQEDSYGDIGFESVLKALRKHGRSGSGILRVGYKRNTLDVDAAVTTLLRHHDTTEIVKTGPNPADARRVAKHPVKAVLMVATYRAAAKFIQKAREHGRLGDTLFVNASCGEALAEELKSIDPRLCPNVLVTQVVPPFGSGSTGVLRYREQLAKYQPQAQPGFVSLEGFIVGSLFAEALKRTGPALTTEKLVDTLETLQDLDLGLGNTISFSMSEHQGSHKVWGTRLDESCTYQVVDLD